MSVGTVLLTPSKDQVPADSETRFFSSEGFVLEEIMKSVALVLVALGLLLAMAAPSMAHGPHYYHHGYARPYYYGGYGPYYGGYGPAVVVAPTVVAPVPVYGYATYPPAVTPVYPPVAPSPCYYYGGPGVSLGYRGRGLSIGVGF